MGYDALEPPNRIGTDTQQRDVIGNSLKLVEIQVSDTGTWFSIPIVVDSSLVGYSVASLRDRQTRTPLFLSVGKHVTLVLM
jgi:hypothetical protein